MKIFSIKCYSQLLFFRSVFTSSNPILSNNKFSPPSVNKRVTNSAVAKVCQDLENKIQLSAHSRWLASYKSLQFTDLKWYYIYLECVYWWYWNVYFITKKICIKCKYTSLENSPKNPILAILALLTLCTYHPFKKSELWKTDLIGW